MVHLRVTESESRKPQWTKDIVRRLVENVGGLKKNSILISFELEEKRKKVLE